MSEIQKKNIEYKKEKENSLYTQYKERGTSKGSELHHILFRSFSCFSIFSGYIMVFMVENFTIEFSLHNGKT